MKWLRLGMFLVLVLGMSACTTPSKSTPVAWRFLAKGFESRIEQPRREVIRNAADWRKFWTRHIPANATNKPPVVDFNKEMVAAVMMGRQKTGAHDIEIVRVDTIKKRTRILVTEYEPLPGARPRKGGTVPFEMIAIPKSEAKPQFVEVRARPKAPWQPLRIDNGPDFLKSPPKRTAGGRTR